MKINTPKLALVTGASAGLGREIALVLAAKGWDLVLSARSEDKLAAVAAEAVSKYGITVYCVTADLSKPLAAETLHTFCEDKSLEVTLLVNNAGAGFFGESVELGSSAQSLLYLNIISLTTLCALFGKNMKKQKKGAVLNIGSIAGNQPTPFFASYAASKSYVLNYSLALRHELAPYGVNVTCVQPGYIRTDFDSGCGIKSEKYKRFSYKNGMSAYSVAKIAVNGVLKGRPCVRAGFLNNCIGFLCALLPKNFLAWILSKSMQGFM